MSHCVETPVESAYPSWAEDQRRCVEIARHFLDLALRFDYLSNGHGHQSSHRVLIERRDRSVRAARLAAATGGMLIQTRPRRGPDAVDVEHAYLREVATLERLTSSEEYRLAVRMRRGDVEARNALIEANLGLVIMFARRLRREGVPLLDLVAEGNLGLLAAARRFDPEVGTRFATYAKLYVLGAMRRALNRMDPLVPAPTEAADPIDAPAEAATEPAPGPEDGDLELQASAATQDRISHDPAAPREDGGAGRSALHVQWVPLEVAAESLVAPESHEPAQHAQTAQRNASLHRALALLSERERAVVVSRFGLVDDVVPTLESLARRFCISIERVRQIEAASVQKLRRLLGDQGQSAHTLL